MSREQFFNKRTDRTIKKNDDMISAFVELIDERIDNKIAAFENRLIIIEKAIAQSIKECED